MATKETILPKPAARPSSREARAAMAWLEGTNPLRGMTSSRAQAIYDAARLGDTVDLQWIYNEIEAADPTLMICAERRSGAVASLDWTILRRSEKRVRGYDKGLADDQAAVLEEAYGEADAANLTQAVEHLSTAFFRGFAHCTPLFDSGDRELHGFDILQGWWFRRNIETGDWLWNPGARAYGRTVNMTTIPRGEMVSVVRTRHIDYPALGVYLRNAVGEKAWGQFMDRYGIPPVIVVMPPDVPPEKLASYLEAAEKVAQGGSGAVPNGTVINYGTEARGANPFSAYLEHQQRQVVLMATGGMLTSLAESGSGTLAGGAHADTWRDVWRRDAVVLNDAMNQTVTRRLLDAYFPGRPHLAYWSLDVEPPRPAADVFEDAGKAKTAGYLVDRAQLEEKSGYRLQPDTSAVSGGGFRLPPAQTPLQNDRTPLQNSRSPVVGTSGRKQVTPALQGIFGGLAADLAPVAERVQALLDLPDAQRAKAAAKLAEDLPGLVPNDPAMAAAMEELLAEAFADAATKEGTES